LKEFTEYQRYKDFIEEHIMDFIPEVDIKSITLHESMKYSLTNGGKRIRPVLLLAACEFSGGDIKSALPYACAIEYIHTYSLIHDDLPAMDNDDLRRGRPTNHKVFGDAIAILAGDSLLNSAFEVMNKDMMIYFDDPGLLKRRVRASFEISKGAGCRGMVAGQVVDIEAQHKSVSGELLDYIHLNKTASLIVAAVKAGCHIGGASKDILKAMEDYAECLGLAFQIADDLLNETGSLEETGKRPGSDRILEKPTYPRIYGLEKSKERLRELTQNALNVIAPYYDNAEFFVRMAQTLEVRKR
jgi:geranylgeranyl diphosphate synthase type II